MTYKFSLFGKGNEFAIGSIPDDIWKYIQEECDGDSSTYNEKLENDEVPKDLKLYCSESEAYECDDLYHNDGCWPSWFRLEVYDENDKVVCTITDIKDVQTKIHEETIDETVRHIMTYTSTAKGHYLEGEFDIEGEFDPKKIKFNIDRVWYCDSENSEDVIRSIEYDGVDIEAEFDCTDGKGDFISFYDLDNNGGNCNGNN